MVAILMSTYNGERYLREQIDSLLNQTYKDWKLYIRDDKSTDGTVSIIIILDQFRRTTQIGHNGRNAISHRLQNRHAKGLYPKKWDRHI